MEHMATLIGKIFIGLCNIMHFSMKKDTLTNKARAFAVFHHTSTLQFYDGKSYSVHLKRVVAAANKFIHLIPQDKREIVLAACWLHDTIEDCRLTYNDIKKVFGEEVADIVFALTNEKGKTRGQRADARYYEGIRNNDLSVFVKVCDRIANFEYSTERGSSMANVYKKEMDGFIGKLHTEKFTEMFSYLRKIG